MRQIKKIVILGGGTSAWLSAAYLSHNLPYFEITVVDKEIGTPVGVGEGTLINFKGFLDDCGFDSIEWIPAIDATFKSGILFPGWVNKDTTVWHPFLMNPMIDNHISLQDAWSVHQNYDFKNYGVGMYDVSVNHNKIDPTNMSAYGCHVDCGKLVQYIQRKLESKVQTIRSEMVSINRDQHDHITSILLKNGLEIHGDLFLDCTGFNGLLAFQAKRNDLKGRLICDTAVAGHVPYVDKHNEMRPYVISEAVDCGWVWNIPVKTRIGSGLVFNRSITDPEKAKDRFVDYWDRRVDRESLKVIDWTPYYNDNIWHENVVAIGLSAGFIEPLESTGIALIMEGIVQLAKQIPEFYYSNQTISLYNTTMKCFFEESINFVSMHYANNQRTEPFWLSVQEQIRVSDQQKVYQEQLLDPTVPLHQRNNGPTFLTSNNWNTWLIQMGYPVAARNISSDYAHHLLLKRWEVDERDRHLWSIPHVSWIDRINELNPKYASKGYEQDPEAARQRAQDWINRD